MNTFQIEKMTKCLSMILKVKVVNEVAKNNGTLQITPKDIKYVFVKSDTYIPEIVDYIQSELGAFSANDLKILVSRVISSEGINVDL